MEYKIKEISDLCDLSYKKSKLLLNSCTKIQQNKIINFVNYYNTEDNKFKFQIIKKFFKLVNKNLDIYKFFIVHIPLQNIFEKKENIFNKSKNEIIKSVLIIFTHNYQALKFKNNIELCNNFIMHLEKLRIINKLKNICQLTDKQINELLLIITKNQLTCIEKIVKNNNLLDYLKYLLHKISENSKIFINIYNCLNKINFIENKFNKSDFIKLTLLMLIKNYNNIRHFKKICDHQIQLLDNSNIEDQDINTDLFHNTQFKINDNMFLLYPNLSTDGKLAIGSLYQKKENSSLFQGHVIVEYNKTLGFLIKGDIFIYNNYVYQYWIFNDKIIYPIQFIIINNKLYQYINLGHLDNYDYK
jgi:hypothetical protein